MFARLHIAHISNCATICAASLVLLTLHMKLRGYAAALLQNLHQGGCVSGAGCAQTFRSIFLFKMYY